VPDLQLADVTIVDQKGNLLSNFAQDEDAVAANKQLEYTAKLEMQFVERVQRMLDPVIGTGHYKAEVTADVDFTAVEQTDEIYNPDLPAIRSEQNLDEQRLPGDAGAGIPGALSNQPPASGSAPEVATAAAGVTPAQAAQPRNVRSQSTRNYELDRSLSYTRHQVGRVRRLSVAVVLDNQSSLNAATGERTSIAWDPATLERITTLVRDAVGYDAARGDSVNVVNAPFFSIPADEEESISIPFWQQAWFFPLLRQSAGVLFILLLVVAVIRPVLRSLSSNVKQLRAIEERHRVEKMLAETAAAQEIDDDKLMLPGPKREYERRVSAVQSMVEGDAERVAQVVRKWVGEND
ncbi:MAG: flagellar M-ring protein FliF, partial [Pseudomonadales bacterium]|nr:flagellar M-ring protein FliF [Pseudomonadales bacterium]